MTITDFMIFNELMAASPLVLGDGGRNDPVPDPHMEVSTPVRTSEGPGPGNPGRRPVVDPVDSGFPGFPGP